MAYVIEKDWITAAGLRAVVIKLADAEYSGYTRYGHRCGYVAVPKGHICFGIEYSQEVDFIQESTIMKKPVDSVNPILALLATSGDVNRLDYLISVHGGLTFSSRKAYSNGKPYIGDYPVDYDTDELWWFGFDCAHYGDNELIGGQTLEYCEEECEKMAKQFAELKPEYLQLPAPDSAE